MKILTALVTSMFLFILTSTCCLGNEIDFVIQKAPKGEHIYPRHKYPKHHKDKYTHLTCYTNNGHSDHANPYSGTGRMWYIEYDKSKVYDHCVVDFTLHNNHSKQDIPIDMRINLESAEGRYVGISCENNPFYACSKLHPYEPNISFVDIYYKMIPLHKPKK